MKKILLVLFTIMLSNITTNSQETLHSKIGQMIMVGFQDTDGLKDSLLYDIANRNLGGVILFGHNLENPTQIIDLTTELKLPAETPLFISTDQEGGVVARLKAINGFATTYSAFQLGTIFNSEDSTRAQSSLMAGWLKDSGINVNLAPVVDVNVDPTSPAIGKLNRSFSSDPFLVYQHATFFIEEFHNKNIATTFKHFPGHGSAQTDSHLGFTDITNTWTDKELIPYTELFADGYEDIVMTGHLYNANWDSLYPASLSDYAIKNILRDSLGFKGVVMSDEMFMQAITNNFGFDEAVVRAVNAGTDILLFRTNEFEGKSIVNHVINLVAQKVNDGEISIATIDTAYNRVIALKNKWLISDVENLFADGEVVPDLYEISNYPNPFNPLTNIVVSISNPGKNKISVYNTLGEQISVLADQEFQTGKYKFSFDGSRLSSGVYLVVLENKNSIVSHKIILMK